MIILLETLVLFALLVFINIAFIVKYYKLLCSICLLHIFSIYIYNSLFVLIYLVIVL